MALLTNMSDLDALKSIFFSPSGANLSATEIKAGFTQTVVANTVDYFINSTWSELMTVEEALLPDSAPLVVTDVLGLLCNYEGGPIGVGLSVAEIISKNDSEFIAAQAHLRALFAEKSETCGYIQATNPDVGIDTPASTFRSRLTKLRELAMDKILYMLPGHSIELPRTVTITSTLPVPRRGNPGTVKTSVNIRLTSVLDAGKATERTVPVVMKIETSFPLGTSLSDRTAILNEGSQALAMETADATNLYYNGLLPQD